MTGPEADALDRIESELSQIADIARVMSEGFGPGEPVEAALRGLAAHLNRIGADLDRMTDNISRN